MKHYICLLLALIFWSSPVSAQHHRWIAPYVPQIDSLFSTYQKGSNPGLAVGVLKGGQLVFSKGYGLADSFIEPAPSLALLNGSASKGLPNPPGPLQDYAGQYYCPELATTYTFQIEGDSLVGAHRYNGKFSIQHVDEDRFSGPSFMSTLRFERDANGTIQGLRVSNGRVLNLWMKKQ